MSGFSAGITGVSSILAILNKLIDFFKTTEVEKEKNSQDAVQKENDDVKHGGLPE